MVETFKAETHRDKIHMLVSVKTVLRKREEVEEKNVILNIDPTERNELPYETYIEHQTRNQVL